MVTFGFLKIKPDWLICFNHFHMRSKIPMASESYCALKMWVNGSFEVTILMFHSPTSKIFNLFCILRF